MLYFIAAVYNEETEIKDLLSSVGTLVDGYRIVDDGSTDDTAAELSRLDLIISSGYDFDFKTIVHTGLPETVKNAAKEMVPDEAWILMLDADERLSLRAKEGVADFLANDQDNYDYVYFNQQEIIDGNHVRSFQKCKLFRKESVTFPLGNIHADDQFEGRGVYFDDWIVYHRKSSEKQIQRELEYLKTYEKLLNEGKIDQGRYEWLKGLHHYVK